MSTPSLGSPDACRAAAAGLGNLGPKEKTLLHDIVKVFLADDPAKAKSVLKEYYRRARGGETPKLLEKQVAYSEAEACIRCQRRREECRRKGRQSRGAAEYEECERRADVVWVLWHTPPRLSTPHIYVLFIEVKTSIAYTGGRGWGVARGAAGRLLDQAQCYLNCVDKEKCVDRAVKALSESRAAPAYVIEGRMKLSWCYALVLTPERDVGLVNQLLGRWRSRVLIAPIEPLVYHACLAVTGLFDKMAGLGKRGLAAQS